MIIEHQKQTPCVTHQTEPHAPSDRTHAIAVIGGGVVGTGMALMLTEHMMQTPRHGEQYIHIIDPVAPGGGVPFRSYSKDPDLAQLYLMNQPNERVAYNPEDPMAFCRFLQPEDPDSVRHLFSPRVFFGDFMTSEYNATQAALQNIEHVHLDHIPSPVLSITPKEAQLTLEVNNSSLVADQTLLALGHQASGQWSHLSSKPGFFEAPCDIDQLQAHFVQDPEALSSPLLLLGSGQSSVDTLAALDELQFKGTIHMISRQPLHFWTYEPTQHQAINDHMPYEMQCLTDAHFSDPMLPGLPWSQQRLQVLIQAELEQTNHEALSPMFLLQKLEQLLDTIAFLNPTDFATILEREIAAGIPQHRLELINSMQETGQLQQHISSANRDDIEFKNGAYHCDAEDAIRHYEYATVINASQFARQAIQNGIAVSPLLQQCLDQGIIQESRQTPGYFQAGGHRQGFYIAAGPQTQRRWVLESYMPTNKTIVNSMLQYQS